MRWEAPGEFKSEQQNGTWAMHASALALMFAVFSSVFAATFAIRLVVWFVIWFVTLYF